MERRRIAATAGEMDWPSGGVRMTIELLLELVRERGEVVTGSGADTGARGA